MASILNSIQQKIDESVPQEYLRGYHEIVAAGLKAMFHDATFKYTREYLQTIKSPDQIPSVVSHGIIKLLTILFNESQGKLQLEAAGAASLSLMVHALDYVESQMKMEITQDILAQTTQLVNQGFAHVLKQASGLNDQQFDQIMQGKGKDLIEQGQGGGPPQPSASPQPSAPPQAPMGMVQGGM